MQNEDIEWGSVRVVRVEGKSYSNLGDGLRDAAVYRVERHPGPSPVALGLVFAGWLALGAYFVARGRRWI